MKSRSLRSRPRGFLVAALLAAFALSIPPKVQAQAADSLLSQGKVVLASSSETTLMGGNKAVDGNSTTRWASSTSDPQWIRVDLGERSTVHRVKLSWEAAYANKYRVEISNDGTSWTILRTVTNGNGNTDDLTGFNEHGRYVRIVGTSRATAYGYSLWEMQVFGVPDSVGDTQAPSSPTALKSIAATATSVELNWNASTDNIETVGYDVLRNGTVVATTQNPSYTDSALTPATSYTYAVRARDTAGNLSVSSSTLTVATPGGAGGNPFILAASGDIADQCKVTDPYCMHAKTAALVGAMQPAAVITMGDNQYDDAHLSDFTNYFDKSWGKFKSIMHPSPGNHESYDEPPEAGYKNYFGPIATPKGKTYYSWDMGSWHFISLDSNDFTSPEFVNGNLEDAADPPQLTWLKQDLAATTKRCVAAYYHHPRFSSGDHGDNLDSASLWSTLVASRVDLVLNGHDHHYERFVPMGATGNADPQGPVEVLAGNGGMSLYPVNVAHATTAKLLTDHGVLKLHMTDTTFAIQLIGLNGMVLDSSPTYTCH